VFEVTRPLDLKSAVRGVPSSRRPFDVPSRRTWIEKNENEHEQFDQFDPQATHESNPRK
jgi:hypothetical protein